MIWALADFGSTFTKVALVDADAGTLLATAQHPTTIDDDVFRGFERARDAAMTRAGLTAVDGALAASSAAGGLRMAAVGLVDDLTAAAARRAALSAGARVDAVWSGALNDDDARAIERHAPDVILFAGGTDGGERRRVIANAHVVARARSAAAVVVACNQDVAEEVAAVFTATGHDVTVVANVLPAVQREHPEPARNAIREIFIGRVVRGKGLSAAEAFFDSILMPSPAAVLACAELLADGTTDVPGIGSVVIVDVGGATTDVHSVIGRAPRDGLVGRASPAPAHVARTVEGDLGVRWNADAVLAYDGQWLAEHLSADPNELGIAVERRRSEPRFVPDSEREQAIDRALATSCVTVALARHVGRLSTRYVPGEGAEVVLAGRDLREVRALLVTGGSIIAAAEHGAATATVALSRLEPSQPAPRTPALLVDIRYIAAAAGLLATVDADAALRLLHAEVPGLGAVTTRIASNKERVS